MYHVSTQGTEEHMINVHYYYYYHPGTLGGVRKVHISALVTSP